MAQLILLEGKKISFDNEEVCSQLSISAVFKIEEWLN